MNHQLMTSAQQSTPDGSAQWALGRGEALSLGVGPGARELHVTEGRLWLTRESTRHAASEDIWLAAGDSLALESGSRWVIEGWGSARFQLLVPPQACATMQRRLSASSTRQRVSPSLEPAPC